MIDLLLAGLLLTQSPVVEAPLAPPSVPALSELHQAQVEAHLFKLRALQLEIKLQQLALSDQRAALDKAIAATYPGFRMDWSTGHLVAAVKDAPK